MSAEEPIRRAEELEREVASLQRRLDRSLGENERLAQEIARLQKLLEDAVRKRKRNTAPFSRDDPKPNPKTPGRKSGNQYGQQATRPTPLKVNEQIAVPLPPCCPHCACQVIRETTQAQYQEDIVRVTVVRRFDVEVGVCAGCGRSVQGRHPLQTSDALHVGQVQIGPEALALAALWNKEMGLSHERVARSLQLGYGLTVSRSGICRALERLGNFAAPTYEQLTASLRHSPLNGLDDTGWRVGGQLQNLRVIGDERVTVYLIEPHRGFAEAAAMLGDDYDGFLVHDGARTWYGFLEAFHQSCLAHPIRRCRDLLKILTGTAREFPQAVLDLLLDSLDLRDRHQQKLVSEHGLAVATGRLEARLDRLLATPQWDAANRHLAAICNMSGPTCSRSCTVRGCRPPTTSLRQRFVRWWWPAKPGVATGPGTAARTDLCERFAHLLATGQRRLRAVRHPTALSGADDTQPRSRLLVSLKTALLL